MLDPSLTLTRLQYSAMVGKAGNKKPLFMGDLQTHATLSNH
jgi:hypothetical protein